MSAAVTPHHVSNVFEENGRLFLKSFLIDDSVNHANWGIRTDYIAKHIDRFVGRPFVLTASRTHPPEFYGGIREDYNDATGTVNRYLQAQEKYRIGTIKKIEPISPAPPSSIGLGGRSSLPASSNQGWFAYIEITDPAAIAAFKAGHIPKYVSPTVYRINHNEPAAQTTDFEPLHLAAVDMPAYGFDKAGIRGSCEGDLVSCSQQLQNASSTAPGFCIKGTLEGFTNRFANSSFVNSSVTNASLTENKVDSVPATTTTTTANAPESVRVTTTDNTATTTAAPVQVKVEPKPEPAPIATTEAPKPEEKREEKKEASPEKKEKETNTKQSNSNEVAELTKTVQALLQEVNGLKSYKDNQEKDAQVKKDAELRAKIEKAIPENYANSPEERTKAIEKLMKYSDDLDYFLEKFVAPTVNAQNKPRSMQQQPAKISSNKLSDYGTVKATPQQQGVQQASTGFDMARMRRIVAMTDIVGNASRGGAQ